MRVAIIVLVVLAAAYLLFVVAAGRGAFQFKFAAPDPDHIDDWTPPDFANTLGGLTASFAPQPDFGGVKLITLPPNIALTAKDAAQTQMARIKIEGPGALEARYECSAAGDKACPSDRSPMVLCLCAKGSPVSSMLAGSCPDPFKNNIAGGVCHEDKSAGNLPVYPHARVVQFFSIGPGFVRASL